ncbi:MAG: META domain-containing protein [Weeksellaceae bacterium]
MKILYLLSFLILMGSCASQNADSNTQNTMENQKEQYETEADEQLLGKWVLKYMSPVAGKTVKELYKIQMPYLTFVDSEKVAGNNGCNNLAGAYSAKGDVIQFETDKFLTTRMFCEGVDESAFRDMLKTINRYTIVNEGKELMLLTSDIVSMTFVKVED